MKKKEKQKSLALTIEQNLAWPFGCLFDLLIRNQKIYLWKNDNLAQGSMRQREKVIFFSIYLAQTDRVTKCGNYFFVVNATSILNNFPFRTIIFLLLSATKHKYFWNWTVQNKYEKNLIFHTIIPLMMIYGNVEKWSDKNNKKLTSNTTATKKNVNTRNRVASSKQEFLFELNFWSRKRTENSLKKISILFYEYQCQCRWTGTQYIFRD